jgi:2-C-methyl-D-erythritol 4-phosphate cytidylyltransferase
MAATRTDDQHASSSPFSVVIPAGGSGTRMGGLRKPFLEVCGQPILYHTIESLQRTPGCAEVIPVLPAEEYGNSGLGLQLKQRFGIGKVALGGPTRQASALAGLELVRDDLAVVLIHDAVRPLVDPEVVRRVADAAEKFGAAIAAVPVAETVKEVAESGVIQATRPRERLWLARTPQGFRKDLILQAHYAARDQGFCGTDDAQLVERLGREVRVVQDTYDNLKITTPEDLAIAEAVLRWRRQL